VRDDVVFELQPDRQFALPRVGLGMASHGEPLSAAEVERLRALHLSHLRVDLNLSGAVDVPLRHAVDAAHALGVPLEVALFVSDDAARELEYFATVTLPAFRPSVCTWLIFHVAEKSTSARWIEMARQFLEGYDSGARFGAGTNAYFAELNRNRPLEWFSDLVCYSINPQVHAFDNASLVETLPAQGVTVWSAREFTMDWPVAVSPVTLKPRFNPDAIAPAPPPAPGELPPQVDVRQMSLFGAGWTLGSIKYLAESGCYSVTYYETTGWRGVMAPRQGSPLPEQFRSPDGAVYPMYHVFANVGAFAGGHIVISQSDEPLAVDGLALSKEGRIRVLLANLGPEPRRVTVAGLGNHAWLHTLDETNAEQAMQNPEVFNADRGNPVETPGGLCTVTLRPFALARVDFFIPA
jgi:hypothetical protein